MTTLHEEAFQPDPRFIIETLIEENKAVSENRLYLLAIIKQIKSEFDAARSQWELERESLKANASAD